MRFTPDQVRTILATVARQIGSDAEVVLFASRVTDHSRGGDIDLLSESPTPVGLQQRASIKPALEDVLQVLDDIVAKRKVMTPTPHQTIALVTGS